MTERLAGIDARIDGIRQLGAVVNAMRGIAASRARQAHGQLAAADSYASVIAAAIGRALTLVPDGGPGRPDTAGRPALVLFCAEQGFAGAFTERVLDAAGEVRGDAELFLIGTRGGAIAAARGIAPHWQTAMPSHSLGVPSLANRVAGALYRRIATGAIGRLDALFSQWTPGQGTRVERIRLFPLDGRAFPGETGAQSPLLNLAPDALLRALTAEYVHARLCHAALHAFAAENDARMEAMGAARRQIERQLDTLRATQRTVRQEEITAEIIELTSGEMARRA